MNVPFFCTSTGKIKASGWTVLQCKHWNQRMYHMSVQALESLRLTDKPFFSASTGTNGCTVLQCKHWKGWRQTDGPFFSTKAGINGWTVLQWEHWINGYTVLQCKHWIGLWQTARPFFSNCWLGWEAASCRQGRHTNCPCCTSDSYQECFSSVHTSS